MLQRKQTIFMLLSAVSAGIFWFFFVFSMEYFRTGNYLLGILVPFPVLLNFISIFDFKKRKRQILINYLVIFINVLLIGLSVYSLLNLSGGAAQSASEKGIEILLHYWQLCLPLFSIVLLAVANHFIKKDEALVKSVDRFR